jgi:Cu+-exporting ATPase
MSLTTIIQVSGMTCGSCTNSIIKELETLNGIESVSVSLLTEEATVVHSLEISTDDLLKKIDDLGFDANLISSKLNEAVEKSNSQTKNDNNKNNNNTSKTNDMVTIIHVGGMTCSSCSNSVSTTLSKSPGVVSANVSLITEEVTVVHKNLNVDDLIQSIEDLGFDAHLISSKSNENENFDTYKRKFKTELTISGMTCTSCVNSITKALKSLSGVDSVSVSLITQSATVIHDEDLLVDSIKETIENSGFDANVIQVTELNITKNENQDSQKNADILNATLKIYKMNNSESAEFIESNLYIFPGILNCEVDYPSETLNIKYDSNVTGVRNIINEIKIWGFDALVINKLDSTSQIDLLAKVKEIKYWRHNFIDLLKFGLPAFFLGHIFPMIKSSCHLDNNSLRIGSGLYIDVLLQLIFGTYIQFWLGRQFYINCYKSLSHGAGSMDVLICVSTTIVYFFSLFSIMHAIFLDIYPTVLFDTSTMLFIFVSLGKWVESKAKGNTSTALSKLLSLTPSVCIIVENPELFTSDTKLTLDSSQISQKRISIDLLQKNDIAIVLPGSKVPSDGECIFGSSDVDESLLTGESSPNPKVVGSLLIGGSVNLSSTLYMRITKLGEHNQLQQIVKLVKEAQISNAPVQRFADSIAAIFVPCILLLSVSTLLFWLLYIKFVPVDSIPKMFLDSDNNVKYFKILQVAISVIVVACPCALGLAAPTAVMVGTGVGASNGILIKGGEILEKASKINTVIFDKTGTLTNGVMELTDYQFLGIYKNQEFLIWSLIYAVESNSEHPMAKALVKGAFGKTFGKNLDSFELITVDTFAGLGIAVYCLDLQTKKELNVKLGNAKFMRQFDMSNQAEFDDILSQTLTQSKISSICHVLIDDVYAGYAELSDTLKPDAKATIDLFTQFGYSVGMVTGDSIQTSKHVAQLLGIPLNNVLAEASPEQKLKYVKDLQDLGLVVAVVGDGINDAPALVQADTGIAIASGTDIAMSASDIVLLSSSINGNSENFETNESNASNLLGIYASFEISKATFNTIKMNFLLAIIYNLIMLPISMGILIIPFNLTLHPMFASAAMACSSTSVVFNSLTLKRWSMDKLKERVNNNLDFKNINLGWNDGIADTRANINELSISSFIVNTGGSRKAPLLVRIFERISLLFKRRPDAYVAIQNDDI